MYLGKSLRGRNEVRREKGERQHPWREKGVPRELFSVKKSTSTYQRSVKF
jgi:hypothetical protein